MLSPTTLLADLVRRPSVNPMGRTDIPAALTLEVAVALLEAQAAKGGKSGGKARGKTATPKAAGKTEAKPKAAAKAEAEMKTKAKAKTKAKSAAAKSSPPGRAAAE